MFCEDTPISPEIFEGGPRHTSGVRYQNLGNLQRVYKFQVAEPPRGWNIVSPKIHLGGSILANKTFWFVDQSAPDFFVERGRNRRRSHFFQISDIWSHSGDIRDQSRKLSKIALNFGLFSPSQILGGRPSKSFTHVMTPVQRHVVWKMFFGDTPTTPEVIVANTLNFKANFKFSRLNFLRGDPRPTSGVRYQGLGNL